MTAISPTAAYDDSSSMEILVASVAMLLLAIQLVNLATFNLQPAKLRLIIDGLSLVGYGGLVAITLLYSRVTTVVHLLGLILFSGAAFVTLALHPESTSLSSFIGHVTSPMLLGILTMRRIPAPGPRGPGLLWLAATAAAVLAVALALLGTPYTLAGIQRLAIFAGGEGGVHPSAYATACFFLTLLVLWRAKVGLRWITLLILGLLAYVLFKYQVRTVWLMLAIFAGINALYWLSRRSILLLVAGIGAALLAAVMILLVMSNSRFDVGRFSSGRTLIYAERLEVISSRGPIELLFGSGSGTDKMRGVSAWRWGEKNSHNDFMTVTIELGLVGLIGFLLMIAAALAALPPTRKGWVIMIITSSLVSNGVLVRPTIGAPLILIAFLSLALRERSLERSSEEEVWLDYERHTATPPLAGASGTPNLARPDV